MSDAMKPIVLDDSLTNSDWVKQGKYGFDFPFVETVEDFEREFKIPVDEPARGKRLEELAKLVWVEVAPEPIRDLLLGVRKSVVLRKMVVRRDAMVEAALTKASFGGDRSAAGRYAAEQRWKGHQKKEPTGGQGRSSSSDTRTTEQKLKDGPQTFAFGRDEKGLPVVGTIEQLEGRFGKDITSQEKYFKDKYGLTVILSVGSGGKKRDTVDPKDTALVYARLASLQALDDICSNLTRVPAKLTVYVTPSIMPTGYFNANINGYVERNAEDSRLATLGVNIKTINECVQYLSGKEFDYERRRDRDEKVNVRFMYEGEPSAVQAVTTNLKTTSEKDRATIVARLAYGVMVHEWGHVLDLKGLWSSKNQRLVLSAPHSSTGFDDDFREASSVSGYGSISPKSAPQEKMAEGFAAWFLFGGSRNVNIPAFWDIDGRAKSASQMKDGDFPIVEIKRATAPLMRPLLDERGDVVKQLAMGLDITKLLPTHPVLLFALQPFVDDDVVKARPENPWKRGYKTQYFRARDSVLARKPLCYKCKTKLATEVDHVRPLIRGGSNTVGNLRPICVSCNRKSGGGERRVRKSVRVDAMVRLALSKASFGGDRSAAGRYAAEQRWKGHVKAEVKGRDVRGGIIETVRREEGMSVKIDSGLQPKDGYMVARKEYSKIVSAEDFFDATKGKKILGDFLKENRERFQKDQYLGIWWNTKTGKVYLDITDNISDREKAESLGKERNQISIWDVVNKVEIQTGGTGEG